MNKSELIAKVATDTRLTRGEAEEVVDATIENIVKALMDGDDVRLTLPPDKLWVMPRQP